jgi:hypothetical protein
MNTEDWGRVVPSLDRAERLTRAIGGLEGWTFGKKLEFAALDYGQELYVGTHEGWHKIEGFKSLPEMDRFVSDLNAATKPIREAYARFLRESLIDELCKVTGKARAGLEEASEC